MLKPSEIEDILRLIDASDFREMKLQIGDLRLELRRGGAPPSPAESAVETPAPPPVQPEAPSDGTVPVPAPMLGVFWHAPRPGDPPFVKPGDRIAPDKIIGIIEVMKLMNTVSAGVEGVVDAVVAPNGKGVEYGQTLIRVRPA